MSEPLVATRENWEGGAAGIRSPFPPPHLPSAHACNLFLVPFCRHQTHELIKRHQNAARQLGKSFRVGSGDVFIVQDFGKLQPHFPVLTLVLYWDDQLFYNDFVMQKCREDPKPRKDGDWVTAAWRWMLYYLRCLPQPVRRVLAWSNTGPNEFRTSRNLGQFRRLAMSFGVRLSVAYACAHHGHSVADGPFGTLSRMERRAERQPGWSPSDVLDTAEWARNTTVLNLGAMQGSYERTRTVYLNLAGVTGGYGLRCFSHFEFHANGKVVAYPMQSRLSRADGAQTHRVMRLSPARAGALRLLEVAHFQRKGAWMLMCLPRPCALYVGEGPRRKMCLMGRRQRAALKALRRSARRCRRSCQSGPKPLFNGTKGSIPVRSSMSVVPLSYLPHFAFSLATRCRSCQRHQFPTCPSHW